MSLKAFHIFFIAVSVLLAAGCAAWGFTSGMAPGFSGTCGALAVALLIYGIYFLRKSRNLII